MCNSDLKVQLAAEVLKAQQFGERFKEIVADMRPRPTDFQIILGLEVTLMGLKCIAPSVAKGVATLLEESGANKKFQAEFAEAEAKA